VQLFTPRTGSLLRWQRTRGNSPFRSNDPKLGRFDLWEIVV
jgi:hypothetical protein